MSSRLTVIFYIVLCLEAGLVLTVLPWWRWPDFFADWGDNYFLVYAAQTAGLRGLQRVVASGWVRGAVTGLGVLNFVMAFWEIIHFNQTVRALETQAAAHRAGAPAQARAGEHAERADTPAADLPHHAGPDDAGHDPKL
jgi:hypothetical protein